MRHIEPHRAHREAFRRVFVDFWGPRSPAGLAIASPGRSYAVVFAADGPSDRPKRRSSRKKLEIVMFCSIPTLCRGASGRSQAPEHNPGRFTSSR